MSSSMRTRFIIDVSGQTQEFVQPFVQPFLELAQDPAQYVVQVPVNSSATLWDGAPPIATYDFLALMSDRDVQVEFVVNGGQSDQYRFTLPLRGGGFPIVVPGGQAYAGQTGSQSAFSNGTLRNITQINVLNGDTVNAAFVSVFVAQAA